MPGCADVNCSNSARKGFIMKHFPKDPERRRQWLIKTRRDNWQDFYVKKMCEENLVLNILDCHKLKNKIIK